MRYRKKKMMYIENKDLRREEAKCRFERIKGFNHENYRKRLLEFLDNID